MRNLFSYFKNIFDTREISDFNMRKFAELHLAMLIANNPGGIYAALIAALTAAYTAYFGAIDDEDTKIAIKEGSTIAMNITVKTFKESSSKQEGLIRVKFGKTSPEYQEFYPHGIEEYHRATLQNIETLMTRLVNAGTKYTAEIGPEFETLFTNIKNDFLANRAIQVALFGEVAGKKDITTTNRNTLENQLMKNLLVIASNNVGNLEAMNTYFDQSFIRPKKTKTFSGKVGGGLTKNIDERHYQEDQTIVLKNTGVSSLKFGLSIDDIQPGTVTITLEAGEKRTVMASELGTVADMHYLNVTNDSTTEGEYKVTVEL